MVDARKRARELVKQLSNIANRSQKITISIAANDGVGSSPGFSDGPNGEHTVLEFLQERWGASDQAQALRASFLAGALDSLTEMEGLTTQTMVRYRDPDGVIRLEPIQEFLGLSEADKAPPTWQPVDPDRLTMSFLEDCYGSGKDFGLPNWGDKHAPNTIGCVRALGWLMEHPTLTFADCKDTQEFLPRDGSVIQAVKDESEQVELARARMARIDGTAGSGVNEVAPFLFCDMPLSELQNANTTADDILRSMAKNYVPGSAQVELDMHLLDDVGIARLTKKAREQKEKIVGPLRLSANALILGPDGTAVIQQKNEPKRWLPRHTFGGSFTVANRAQKNSKLPSDGKDIVRCVRREVLEESNIALPMSLRKPFDDIPTLLLLQTDPPYLQVVFLGWHAPDDEIANAFKLGAKQGENDQEGTALHLPLFGGNESIVDDLVLREKRHPWRAAGLLALYAWYAIGCPGIDGDVQRRFRRALAARCWSGANVMDRIKQQE